MEKAKVLSVQPEASRRSNLRTLMFFVSIGLLFYGYWLITAPPHGTYAQVEITLFSQGDQMSVMQQQLLHQMSQEYTGAITYHTVAIPPCTGCLYNEPMVKIAIKWFGKNGTELRETAFNLAGPVPDTVIEGAIITLNHASRRTYWPGPVYHFFGPTS